MKSFLDKNKKYGNQSQSCNVNERVVVCQNLISSTSGHWEFVQGVGIHSFIRHLQHCQIRRSEHSSITAILALAAEFVLKRRSFGTVT